MKKLLVTFSIIIMIGTLNASAKESLENNTSSTLSTLDKKALETTMKELMKKSISLLKAGEAKKTLILLVHPEEKQRDKIIDDKFVDTFKKYKAKKLIEILEEALSLSPYYISNKIVSYKLNRHYLTFKKFNGRWYLSTHKGKISQK